MIRLVKVPWCRLRARLAVHQGASRLRRAVPLGESWTNAAYTKWPRIASLMLSPCIAKSIRLDSDLDGYSRRILQKFIRIEELDSHVVQ